MFFPLQVDLALYQLHLRGLNDMYSAVYNDMYSAAYNDMFRAAYNDMFRAAYKARNVCCFPCRLIWPYELHLRGLNGMLMYSTAYPQGT